jgi:serralysin
MSVSIGTLSASAQATVSFLTGVTADGALIQQNSGWSWDPNAGGAVYDGYGWSHKWGGGAAGTAATVTYAFDPAAKFTAAEQGIITAAMALWSAESGIVFTPAASLATAQDAFYRFGTGTDPGGSDGVYTNYTAPAGSVGATDIPATQSAYTSYDTLDTGFEELSSFTAYGGYGVDTVVHELGHVLGLFHSGPYNSSVNPMTQQFNATDSRQWSIMSYINPNTPAKYSAQYTYSNTDWGASADGFVRVPTTPMPLDILAAQRLYGLPATTPLDGGQVFGFNTNIAAPIRQFFDFTVNTAPIVTLWDEGTGNALDLSGFSEIASVDLRPGTFSSAGGLTNNIGIAYGTAIDRLVGAQGGGTVTLNDDGDTVLGTGGANTVIVPDVAGAFTVGGTAAGAISVLAGGGAVDSLQGVQALQFAGGQDTVVASGAPAILATSASVGSLIFGGAGTLTVVNQGAGIPTIVSGLGDATVVGGAGAEVWGTRALNFWGGSGASTVAGAPTGSVTVVGNGGGGLFVGGGAGNNDMVANGGAATMFGGGGGDQLIAANAANNRFAAGPGAETVSALASTGSNVLFAGSAQAVLIGGAGATQFVVGAGDATVTAGSGADLLDCIDGFAGGSVTVQDWNPAQDHIALYGYDGDEAAHALADAVGDGHGGTLITLSDDTRIVFADVTGLNTTWFA